jgi:predicted ABC-type exoprotein transport system permease subunit
LKVSKIIIILIISAWPLYYLYEVQLGAVSFLLLAIFFLVIAIKEIKMSREQEKEPPEEKNE